MRFRAQRDQRLLQETQRGRIDIGEVLAVAVEHVVHGEKFTLATLERPHVDGAAAEPYAGGVDLGDAGHVDEDRASLDLGEEA